MVTDTDLAKTLNLPRTAPSFAYRQHTDGSLDVLQPNSIPKDGSIYWLAGDSILSNGRKLTSVFIIEDGGGNLVASYWFIADNWYKSDDDDVLIALGLQKREVFPFDWQYAIPVDNDVYHQ